MQVYIYSSDQEVVDGLARKYPKLNWSRLMEAKAITDLPQSDDLVIVLKSPVQVGSILVSPEALWKKYLTEHFPGCKFIVAGFTEAQHTNYLDLLNLPDDFEQGIDQALPAKEDWEPVCTGAVDMQEKMKNFFSGHGKESIIDILGQIQRPIKMTLDAVKIQQRNFQESAEFLLSGLSEHWESLENRWQRYFFLFTCLPFFDLFEKSSTLIKSLNAYFQHDILSQKEISDAELVYQTIISIRELISKANSYV